MLRSWATSFRLARLAEGRLLSLGFVGLAFRGRPFTFCLERKIDENRSADCTLSAWPRLSCIWAEWFPAFHSGAASASRTRRPICGGADYVTLLSCSVGVSTRGRRAAARESLRAARAGPSWPCDCEHLF